MRRSLVAMGVGALLLSSTAHAKVVKTKRTADAAHEVVVGSRIEIEDREFESPVLVEWSPTSKLELSLEIAYAKVELDSGERIGGLKNLDFAAVYELVPARRDRPSLALEFSTKLPTAGNRELDSSKPDFGAGAILSWEFRTWDAQIGAAYTFAGSSQAEPMTNAYELSVAAEWHPGPRLDVFAEVVAGHGGTSGGFGVGGPSLSGSSGGGNEIELTTGLAEHLTRHFKLEQGITYSDATVLFVLGWEYDFGFAD